MTKNSRLFPALISLIALCAIVFSLAACSKGGDYPEIPSSKKEATPVATLGGHEVRYELYRAFFSAMYSGKTEGMTEEGYAAARNAVMREIALIYATLDVAKESGVDPEGDKIDAEVTRRVKIDYEGGESNGVTIEGVGTREKYKEALAAANLTDAVNRLIYRYDATQAELFDYFVNKYAYGRDEQLSGDPQAFFASEACAHGVWVYVPDDLHRYDRAETLAFAREMHDDLATATSYADVRRVLIRTMSDRVLSDDEMEHGFYVSRNQGNTPLERALVADFFSLAPLACGEIREDSDGVWFAVGLEKDAADLDRDPNAIYDLMLEETMIDRPIAERAETYLAGVSYSSACPTFSEETLAELTLR